MDSSSSNLLRYVDYLIYLIIKFVLHFVIIKNTYIAGLIKAQQQVADIVAVFTCPGMTCCNTTDTSYSETDTSDLPPPPSPQPMDLTTGSIDLPPPPSPFTLENLNIGTVLSKIILKD